MHAACLPDSDNTPNYYPTWTALQHHIRTAHPPTCTHASCNGRVFASQHGLRAHQRLHEQRDVEEKMAVSDIEDSDSFQSPRKKRRGGEIGRDWKCDVDGCIKDFKSVSTLLALECVALTFLSTEKSFECPCSSHTFGLP